MLKCKNCHNDLPNTNKRRTFCSKLCGSIYTNEKNRLIRVNNQREEKVKDEIGEVWLDVSGYVGQYKVSNFGRVKSFLCDKEKILKQYSTRQGYLRVGLNNTGAKLIHILVANAFLPPKNDDRIYVNHINENKKDNNINNLEWVNNRENVSYSKRSKKLYSSYTGVTYSKSAKLFVAKISVNKKAIHLGYFNDEFSAHLAYKEALLKYNIKNKYAIDSIHIK